MEAIPRVLDQGCIFLVADGATLSDKVLSDREMAQNMQQIPAFYAYYTLLIHSLQT